MFFFHNTAVLWVASISYAALIAFLTEGRKEGSIIKVTSLAGSFLCVYGIGMVAGRYTNPFLIAELINEDVIYTVDPMFYVYLVG